MVQRENGIFPQNLSALAFHNFSSEDLYRLECSTEREQLALTIQSL